MQAEKAVRALLLGDAEVFARVGSRIYHVTFPQGSAMPVITYQRISGQHEYSQDGLEGLETARIQVSVWTEPEDYADAKLLGDKVKLALSGYVGTTGGVQVEGIFALDDSDLYEVSGTDATAQRMGVAWDFEVQCQEST